MIWVGNNPIKYTISICTTHLYLLLPRFLVAIPRSIWLLLYTLYEAALVNVAIFSPMNNDFFIIANGSISSVFLIMFPGSSNCFITSWVDFSIPYFFHDVPKLLPCCNIGTIWRHKSYSRQFYLGIFTKILTLVVNLKLPVSMQRTQHVEDPPLRSISPEWIYCLVSYHPS